MTIPQHLNQPDPILDRILLRFSDLDVYTARDACAGTVIFGEPGSGKTSTSGARLAKAHLKAGHGGLVLCVKGHEAKRWLEYARATGREKDVILFSLESGLRIDPISYEWSRPGRGAHDYESTLDHYEVTVTQGRPRGTGESGFFWETLAREQERMALIGSTSAGRKPSIAGFAQFASSLPTSREVMSDPNWQSRSLVWQLLREYEERHPERFVEGYSIRHDMDEVADYALDFFPNLDPRTSSNILAEVMGPASPFKMSPLKEIFSSGVCDFTPDQMFTEGKVIICDCPYLQRGKTGLMVNGMLKNLAQWACLRRDVTQYPRVVFIWQDEAQLLMAPGDRENRWAQVARESRIANVWISQSVANISEQRDEHQTGSRTKALLGNLTTKIFHTVDFDTAQYAADVIGMDYTYLSNFRGSDKEVSVGRNESLQHRILPSEFSALAKADGMNKVAETIVYQGGKRFECTKTAANPNGRNFLRVAFSR